MLILITTGACGNKKLQGLLVAESVNYDFVKATTLTDEF